MTWLIANWRVVALVLSWVAGIGGVLVWDHRERVIGEAEIRKSDAAATRKVLADTAAQTAQLSAQAAQAHKDATNAQQQVAAYLAANPIGPVYLSVRHEDSCAAVVPKAPAARGGTAATGARPVAVPAVPAGAAQVTGDGLTVLVQAAAELAAIDAEWQRR